MSGLCFVCNKLYADYNINPLWHEFCFPSIFEIYSKTGSYSLPTHRRGAHRKVFP